MYNLIMIMHAKFKERSININGLFFSCLFGRDGVSLDKKEGDWKTPAGSFMVKKIYYRSDKKLAPSQILECTPIEKNDGWCDDINSVDYNKHIKTPFDFSHEELWREDDLYDLILVLNYNTEPVVLNKGSAIFIHVAKDNMQFTKGCLALKKEDLLFLISNLDNESVIEISE